ncbi:MAG: TlpA disulfide reductase family protein [Acidobacteriota bacterium]
MPLLRLALVALCLTGISASPAQTDQSLAEERELQRALAEVGASAIDLIRALEGHLARYPNSSHRAELEQALAKAALETGDEPRIIRYGEPVLAREPDDIQLLERVTRALLSGDDKQRSQRALKYARSYRESLQALRDQSPPGRISAARWREETDRGLGRALALEARATGNLGKLGDAVALARQSYDAYPAAEAAREIARWLNRSGKEEEALGHYADAFAISEPRNTDADRAAVRLRLGELYRKLKGSEAGLGDLLLEAYDRTTALVAAYRLKLRQADPNTQLTDPMEFTLSGLGGDKLALASLKGKVVVLDFWATWCGPCRVQQPLYEKVKRNFKNKPEVVFLAINTDENREIVPEFLRAQKWDKRVYYEDGLSTALEVHSIPTTIVINRRGQVFSRMNGFIPERFVDMLSERIEEALTQ